MRVKVAPRVGAWIETGDDLSSRILVMSHPEWVRGLKLLQHLARDKVRAVAPRVGAWIETLSLPSLLFTILSHPEWVRGLKPFPYRSRNDSAASHPEWVRGLKPISISFQPSVLGRTPSGCVD